MLNFTFISPYIYLRLSFLTFVNNSTYLYQCKSYFNQKSNSLHITNNTPHTVYVCYCLCGYNQTAKCCMLCVQTIQNGSLYQLCSSHCIFSNIHFLFEAQDSVILLLIVSLDNHNLDSSACIFTKK